MLTFFNKIFHHWHKTSSFILGSLSVQALPPFYHWYILFFTISGLLHLIHQAPTKKQAFARGYWFGFGFFSFGLTWISNALLISPEKTGWLIPITFIASGAFFGIFIGLPALLSKIPSSIHSQYLSFSAWITIFEWIRSWILTGFPWNLWGTSLSFSLELIQFASVLGTYGLSFLLLLTVSAPFLWIENKTKLSALQSGLIIIAIPTFLYFYGHIRILKIDDTNNSPVKIRLVQPGISQKTKWHPNLKEEHFNKYINKTISHPLDDISMVVWGETASPYPLDLDEKSLQKALNSIPQNGYLVTGLIRYQTDYYGGWFPFNSSLVINKNGTIEDYYDKSHLVPFGEYIPLKQWLPNILQPVANIIGTLTPGDGHKIITLPKIPTFGIQICYEIIFPHQVINPKQKPEWLINLTNDGWYGISAGPYQHLVNTQMRSVEEGLTIIRSANNGISALINRYGKIISQLDLQEVAILDVNLPQKTSIKTTYNSYGNIPILLICFAIIIITLCKKLKAHKTM